MISRKHDKDPTCTIMIIVLVSNETKSCLFLDKGMKNAHAFSDEKCTALINKIFANGWTEQEIMTPKIYSHLVDMCLECAQIISFSSTFLLLQTLVMFLICVSLNTVM